MKIGINKLFFLAMFMLQLSFVCVNVEFLKESLFTLKFFGLILLMFCAFLRIKEQKFCYDKIVIMFFLFVTTIITWFISSDIIFVELFFMLLVAMNVEFEKILKIDYIIKIILFIFVIICYFLGLTTNNFVVTRGEMIRSDMGFYHPNTFGMFLMILFFEYVYLSRKKSNKHIFVGILVILIINLISDTRSAIYSIIMYLILYFFSNKKNQFLEKKIVSKIVKNIYWIMLGVSIITTVAYMMHVKKFDKINYLLSNRLILQAQFLEEYNVNLFGNNVLYTRTLDNGFIKLLLNYGIVTTIFYGVINKKNLIEATNNKDFFLMITMIVIMFYTIFESSMLYVHYNIFMIYFFTNNKKIEEKDFYNDRR